MLNLRKHIGNNIRAERLSLNISMEELAEMLELSPAFVGLIERGQRGASVKNIVKIANIFGVTVDSIVSENSSAVNVREMNKETLLNSKRETLRSILFDFDEEELDFIISIVKNLRKLKQKSNLEKSRAVNKSINN